MKNISKSTKVFVLSLLAGLSLSSITSVIEIRAIQQEPSWSDEQIIKFVQKPEIEKLLKLVHSFGTPELIRKFQYSEKAEACIQAFINKNKGNMSPDDQALFAALFE